MRIYKNEVLNALKKISSFISPSGVSPVLGCTMFNFKSDKLRLMGTNLESYYYNDINLENNNDPQISLTIDTKIATNIISTFTAEFINIKIDTAASTITFSANDAELSASYMSADDFPAWFAAENLKPILKLDDKNIFITAVNAVKHCPLKGDESKPAFNGIHVNITDSYVFVEATDGKRAARAKYANAGNAAGSYIVPPALFENIPEKTALEISSDGVFIGFNAGSECFYTRLIDGKFPDLNAVLPKDHKIKVEIGASKMSEHIKFVEAVAKDNSYSVKFSFSKSGVKLSAAAKTNKAKSEYKEAVCDGDLDINFNAKYFRETLTALQNEKATLKFSGSQAPVHVTEEKDGVEYEHILMPVRPAFTA